MAQPEAPLQPLPSWMIRTYVQVGPSSSTLVTLQYPQTYYGQSLPGLTWPWVYPTSASGIGVQVSVVGGPVGLTTLYGSVPEPTSPTTQNPEASNSRGSIVSQETSFDDTSIGETSKSGTGRQSSDTRGSIRTTTPSISRTEASTVPTTDRLVTTSTQGSLLTTTRLSTGSKDTTPSTRDPASATAEQSRNSSVLSGGAIAGIVIGTLILLTLASLLIFACCRRYRKQYLTGTRNLEGMEDSIPAVMQESRRTLVPRDLSQTFRPRGEKQALMTYRDDENNFSGDEEEDGGGRRRSGQGQLGVLRLTVASIIGMPGGPQRQASATASQITDHTDSTRTRRSFVSDVPVYLRKPSDQSSDDDAGGRDARRSFISGSAYGQTLASARSGQDGGLFAVSPARPPSQARTVPYVSPSSSTTIGLGRPPQSPRGPRTPRLSSVQEAEGESTHSRNYAQRMPSNADITGAYHPHDQAVSELARSATRTSPPSSVTRPYLAEALTPDSTPYSSPYAIERNASNRSSETLGGAPRWMGGYAWLRSYLDGSSPSSASEPASPPTSVSSRLPSAAQLSRGGHQYKRVTTTAAAFDLQDLRDLAERRSALATQPAESGNERQSHRFAESGEHEGDEDEGSAAEGRSFLGSDLSLPASPAAAGRKASASRWSRATLGQPISRLSAISSVSLSDLQSISARARDRSKSRSRSGSQSGLSQHSRDGGEVEDKSPSSTISRSSSRMALSAHGKKSPHSNSKSNSTLGVKSRRSNNSSAGSQASSGKGSVRSTASDRRAHALRPVSERTETAPPLPTTPTSA